MTSRADLLLNAHVEYELSRLEGEALAKRIDEHVAAMFRWFAEVKFAESVTREQILGVIERYVIELKVSGGITELAGEMANAILASEWSAKARIRDVLHPEAYEEFADKIVALDAAFQGLIRLVIESSAVGTLTARVLSRMVADVFFRQRARGDSPLQGVLSALGAKVPPALEEQARAALFQYFERRVGRFTQEVEKHVIEVLDAVALRELADEIWDTVSDRHLIEAMGPFTAQDLEDFVVLGYEFWLKFRRTPYFRAVVTEVVDRLFTKYGDETVSAIIDDMGISEEMVASEIRTFFVPLFAHARRTGFLEERVRAILTPFYASPEARAILSDPPDPSE